MSTYLGDYAEDYATLNFKFTTRAATGVPTNPVGLAVAVYKGSATGTESTAGVTLAATGNFDTIAGLNNLLIDLSADAFYAVANDYAVVVTAGTVGGVSIIGETICTFSIENRFAEADLVKIDGQAVNDNLATLKLKCLDIRNTGGELALRVSTSATPGLGGTAAQFSGYGSGSGISVTSGVGGIGVNMYGGRRGLNIYSADAGSHAIEVTVPDGGYAMRLVNNSDDPASILGNIVGNITGTLTTVTNLTNIPAGIPTSDAVAQAILKTDVSDVQDTASAHSITTLVLGATESSLSGLTWTIKKTDGTTFATKTVTSDSAANPITGVT